MSIGFAQVYSNDLHEKDNCTVMALTCAASIDYKVAKARLADCGRMPRKGAPLNVTQAAYSLFSEGYVPMQMTVGAFIRRNPTGRFIVRIKGHVFAVIDGSISDFAYVSEYKNILGFWAITKGIGDAPKLPQSDHFEPVDTVYQKPVFKPLSPIEERLQRWSKMGIVASTES